MIDQKFDQQGDMSFFIHLWLERSDRSTWRGKVTDGDQEQWFEDEHSLLTFIRGRLRAKHRVSLPRRRVQG